jgi:hypothetical protein
MKISGCPLDRRYWRKVRPAHLPSASTRRSRAPSAHRRRTAQIAEKPGLHFAREPAIAQPSRMPRTMRQRHLQQPLQLLALEVFQLGAR